MVSLVDSHTHLQDNAFDKDRDSVLLRSKQNGVNKFICNATSENDWESVLDLAKANNSIIPFIGIHPWFVNQVSSDWDTKLSAIIEENTISGIGEIGLDRWKDNIDTDKQESIFRKQLELAYSKNLPASIHCLKAWDWLTCILEDIKKMPVFMIHAYSGSKEMLDNLLRYNCYFSFGGGALYPNRKKSCESLKAIPVDRLLIETDSPDMIPPEEYCSCSLEIEDGKRRNEPANLRGILTGIAKITGLPEDELAEQTTANAKRFLNGAF